jgi:hypothetical protein
LSDPIKKPASAPYPTPRSVERAIAASLCMSRSTSEISVATITSSGPYPSSLHARDGFIGLFGLGNSAEQSVVHKGVLHSGIPFAFLLPQISGKSLRIRGDFP